MEPELQGKSHGRRSVQWGWCGANSARIMMRYVIYGDDAVSRHAREPFVIEAGSEAEARGRAVARGVAVRAVIAEPPAEAVDVPAPAEERAPNAFESDEMRGLGRTLRLVVTPLVIAFFLLLAMLRTLLEAAAWTIVWLLGLLLGGGIGGVLMWSSRGSVPAETAWPIGMIAGLAILSALHGAQVGWRWWWAKRSLAPLAQAFGVTPEQAGAGEPHGLRLPVVLAQSLAGAVLGGVIALVGWATEWGFMTAMSGIPGGALGLGIEGAILGAVMARRRPVLPPGAAAGPSFESLAGLLARLWGQEHLAGSWVLGYTLDRAAPGAVAGIFIGVAAFFLGWFAVSG
jgi:hypothetical protein